MQTYTHIDTCEQIYTAHLMHIHTEMHIYMYTHTGEHKDAHTYIYTTHTCIYIDIQHTH